jgi:hypothetical protein
MVSKSAEVCCIMTYNVPIMVHVIGLIIIGQKKIMPHLIQYNIFFHKIVGPIYLRKIK